MVPRSHTSNLNHRKWRPPNESSPRLNCCRPLLRPAPPPPLRVRPRRRCRHFQLISSSRFPVCSLARDKAFRTLLAVALASRAHATVALPVLFANAERVVWVAVLGNGYGTQDYPHYVYANMSKAQRCGAKLLEERFHVVSAEIGDLSKEPYFVEDANLDVAVVAHRVQGVVKVGQKIWLRLARRYDGFFQGFVETNLEGVFQNREAAEKKHDALTLRLMAILPPKMVAQRDYEYVEMVLK